LGFFAFTGKVWIFATAGEAVHLFAATIDDFHINAE
jgi:hypothetical protein